MIQLADQHFRPDILAAATQKHYFEGSDTTKLHSIAMESSTIALVGSVVDTISPGGKRPHDPGPPDTLHDDVIDGSC